MDAASYLAFLAISFGLIVVPGPNVLVIVSTSITHGSRRGLQTVAGTSLAMAIQLSVVGVGTSWFVALVSDGLHYLKWLGVAYLLYLGLSHLKSALTRPASETPISATATFARGFMVSLTNPKTLLFFSAFLPQFVSAGGAYNIEILILSLIFLMMAMVLDSCYAVFSTKLANLIMVRHLNRYQSGMSGLLFLGASAWLALTRRAV